MPPAGFKRSRALWDDARRPRNQKLDKWSALLRAILYELQPIRLSEYEHVWWTINLRSFLDQRMRPFLRQSMQLATRTIPRFLWSTVCSMTVRQWSWVVGTVMYYFFVRWVHELLDAGPMMLMVTALVAIFTIGLGERAEGELSAYSVFNRGFQRLMGSIDVDELVNQHVGGGIMNVARPAAEDNHNLQGRNDVAVAARQEGEDDNDDDSDEEHDNLQNDRNNANRGARRSGKKSRRRNLEERREQQRQRDAARAMGFDGAGGPEEMMAMQRLIEEQVAREHQG